MVASTSVKHGPASLADLYEADESAWLDAMTKLIEEGRLAELDYSHLAEYLSDMARRDRREVRGRLRVLLAHLLKWLHQPEQRSNSWRGTIINQRHELAQDITSGVLRRYAEVILAEAYAEAAEQAAAETGLPAETFTHRCPFNIDQLLTTDLTQTEG